MTVLVCQDHSLEYGKRNSRSSMFRIVPKFKKEKAAKKTSPQSGRGGARFLFYKKTRRRITRKR